MPAAFAIGVRRDVHLHIETADRATGSCVLIDGTDPTVAVMGMPVALDPGASQRVETAYTVIPTRRGESPSRRPRCGCARGWGLCELHERIGDGRQCAASIPDFAQIARYAWLAGDRRLQEIGIKTYQQRGQGTDFKQLSEYRTGDSVRHIDWRATLRLAKPIVREFQDERDQCVMLLVDCGRRMRADDRQRSPAPRTSTRC